MMSKVVPIENNAKSVAFLLSTNPEILKNELQLPPRSLDRAGLNPETA